jgi:hypothetical protein
VTASSSFAAFGAAAEAAVSFRELAVVLSAEMYRYPVPWRCSRDCGRSIRRGEMFVQTSKDRRPLTRAHAACVAGRKGTHTPVLVPA